MMTLLKDLASLGASVHSSVALAARKVPAAPYTRLSVCFAMFPSVAVPVTHQNCTFITAGSLFAPSLCYTPVPQMIQILMKLHLPSYELRKNNMETIFVEAMEDSFSGTYSPERLERIVNSQVQCPAAAAGGGDAAAAAGGGGDATAAITLTSHLHCTVALSVHHHRRTSSLGSFDLVVSPFSLNYLLPCTHLCVRCDADRRLCLTC